MSGLKRVTLCSNPLLGDKGAVALSETLKDDLWLKGGYFKVFFIWFVGGKSKDLDFSCWYVDLFVTLEWWLVYSEGLAMQDQ